MKAFHITTEENAENLRLNGADVSRVGSGAGVQGGRGFYLAPDKDDARYWLYKIGQAGCVVLSVAIPDTARFAQADDLALDADKLAWAEEQGWFANRYFTTQFWSEIMDIEPAELDAKLTDPSIFVEDAACWTLAGLWAAAHGYDGYYSQGNTLVVTNYSLLPAAAFGEPINL